MASDVPSHRGGGRPGPARATRAGLSRTLRREVLSREAEELLFTCAELMTEARVDERGYSGSTMITFDLARVAEGLRDLSTEADRQRLLRVVEGSVRVRIRSSRFACAEAARRVPDRSLGTFSVETRMRLDGSKLLVDVDVDAPFAEVGRENRA